MSEILKLRTRLTNVSRHTIEYRMTVVEAKALLREIDELLKPKVIETPSVEEIHPTVIYRVMDAGSL